MTNSDYLEFEPLLLKVVNKYIMNPYLSIEDLKQVGAIGMVKGFRNYDPNKGMKLSTYLYKNIEWAILQELNNYSRVKEQYTVVSLESDLKIKNGGNISTVPRGYSSVWESVRFASERSRVRVPLSPPIEYALSCVRTWESVLKIPRIGIIKCEV